MTNKQTPRSATISYRGHKIQAYRVHVLGGGVEVHFSVRKPSGGELVGGYSTVEDPRDVTEELKQRVDAELSS